MGQRNLRVGFVTTHPIQYHAAWFRALAQEPTLDFEVLYCHQPSASDQGIGFGVPFTWDMPLLDGYRYRFLKNVATKPALGSYRGLDTPELRSLISAARYDAVVVNGWHYKSLWQAIRACWTAGVPVLVRSDSHLHTPRHPLKQLLKVCAVPLVHPEAGWLSRRRAVVERLLPALRRVSRSGIRRASCRGSDVPVGVGSACLTAR